MKPFLLRLVLFLGIHASAVAALLVFFSPPAAPPRAVAAVGLAPGERLAMFLKDTFRKNALVTPNYLSRMDDPQFRDLQLRQALKLYHVITDNYNTTIIDKDHLIKTAPGPRMIFVGGSGMAFGMDSELVARRYGYSPVNMGLTAGLGARFMLQHVGPYVREGDVVVICFEDVLYYRTPDSLPDLQALICEVAPEIGRFFDPAAGFDDGKSGEEEASRFPIPPIRDLAAWKEFADRQMLPKTAGAVRASLLALAFQSQATTNPQVPNPQTPNAEATQPKVADAFAEEYDSRAETLLARAKELDATMERETVYVRSAFNKYGDRTLHWGSGPLPGDRSGWAVGQPSSFPENHPARATTAATAKLIEGFAEHCRRRGAMVLVALPPRVAYPGCEAFHQPFENYLDSLLTVPLICRFDKQLFPEDYFFNTRNHLTWQGTKARMAVLLNDLDRYVTPQTKLSVEQQIAARDEEVRSRFRTATAPAPKQVR